MHMMIARPTTPLLLLVMALAGPAAAQRPPAVDVRHAFDARGSVRLYNMIGSVRVIGWERDSLVITGTLGAGSRFFGSAGVPAGASRGAKYGVELSATDGAQPTHLEVRAPAGSRIWIKTAGADVSVTGITGGVDVYTVGGTIRVAAPKAAPRELNLETMDGSIQIDASPAWLRAKTASGAITMRGSGDDVVLSSVSGAISVAGGPRRFQRGRFESVTGDIRFSGALDRGGSFTFDSHSGGIELALSPGDGADFEISSIQGQITNQLTSRTASAGRELRGQELSFTTGTGGAHVTIRSFKGPVVLVAK